MNLFELFVKIGAKDEASGAISAISEKLGKGLKTAAKIGTVAVATATAGIAALTSQAVKSFAEYEQLAGGAAKIFDEMSQTEILQDAQNAYKDLGISANQYLAIINDVGATFAATMGDKKGYEAAKKGLKAISDYASGTGKNVDELSQKFTLITRSTSSYQSIADQFSGILPATSSAFLEQAQAVGVLSDEYKNLTEVPIDEYQEAVAAMLEQGVADLGLAGNTAAEAMTTISGSLAATKAAWSNLITGFADDGADLETLMNNLVTTVVGENGEGGLINNIVPTVKTALSGIGTIIGELAPVISSELPSIIEDVLPTLLSSAVVIVENLSSALPDLIQSLLPSVTSAISSIIETAASVLPDAVSAVAPALISALVEVAGVILQNAPTFISEILKLVPMLVEEISGAAISLAPELASAIVSVVRSIANNLQPIIDALVVALPLITEAVNTAIEENAPALLQAIIDIVMLIVENLPTVMKVLNDQIAPIVSTITSVLLENLPLLLDGIAKIVLGIVKALPELTKSLAESVLGIFEGIGTGIVDAWPKFKEGMADLWDRLSEWIGEKWDAAKTWGKDLIDNFINGIKEKWQDLKQTVSDVAQSIKDFIGFSEPKKGPLSNFHTYAPDMMDLFAKGIRENESVVTDQLAKSFNFGKNTMDFGTEYGSLRGGASSSFGGTSIGNVTINISGVDVDNVDQLADLIADKLNSDIINRRLAYG